MHRGLWGASLLLLLLPYGGQNADPATPLLAINGATRDWELTLRIRQALAKDAEIGSLNPSVHVRGGVATISGPAPSGYFRRRAEELVRAVPGVRQVNNELRVGDSSWPEPRVERQRPPSVARFASRIQMDQDDLTFAVERVLRSNPRFHGVTATVINGQVLLGGKLPESIDDLITALTALEGVREVHLSRARSAAE
jgi:osmotically-inducible protein OsmY